MAVINNFGTNVSVCSCIWVAAWKMAIVKPIIKLTVSMGAPTFIADAAAACITSITNEMLIPNLPL
jgi:hypothetical protein